MITGAVNSAGTDWPLFAVAVETDRRSLKRTGVPAGRTMVLAIAEPADASANRRAKEAAVDVFVVMAPSAAIPVLGRHGRLRWLPKARPQSSLDRFCRSDSQLVFFAGCEGTHKQRQRIRPRNPISEELVRASGRSNDVRHRACRFAARHRC